MAYTPHLLSGSSYGRPIEVTSTTTASANTIHTTGTSATILDQPELVAWNERTSTQTLKILWGGVLIPHEMTIALPGLSGQKIVSTINRIAGDGSAANSIKAYSSAATGTFIGGGVNRYTP